MLQTIYFSELQIQQRLERISEALCGDLVPTSKPTEKAAVTSRDKLNEMLKRNEDRYGHF